MSAFSPLFRHAAMALRDQAAAEFGRTTVARVLREVGRIKSSGRADPDDLARRLGRDLVRSLGQVRATPLRNVLATVEKYARAPGDEGAIIREILASWGPLGRALLELVAVPGSIGADLGRQFEAALRLVQALGQVSHTERDWIEGVLERSEELLRTAGYQVYRPGQEPPGGRPPSGPRPSMAGTQPRDQDIELAMAWEPPRRFPPHHPIVTGDMVPAPGSSNVHSFGYDYEQSTLYVRFLDTLADGVRAGPGPLYAYYNVEPEMFLDLLEAPSKGNWVWDHLRIRGTLSGHRKDYRLVGVVRGYVPRKAALTPEGEAWIRRTVRTTGGRWLRSVKPDELIYPLRPVGPVSPQMRPFFGL